MSVYKGGATPFTFEKIQKFAKANGYSVAGKYANQESLLVFTCMRGNHKREMTFRGFRNKIRKGQKCKLCYANEKLRLDFAVIIKEAKKRGHKVLSKPSEYKVAKSPIRIRCEVGHEFKTTWDMYSSAPSKGKRSTGCRECGRIRNSLDGNYNYKGFGPVRAWARTKLFDWKRDALQKHDYQCFITGKSGVLEVHHPENFSNIFWKALELCELPDHKSIDKYSRKELLQFEKTLRTLHDRDGIPMLKDVHRLFHTLYGNCNNTFEQVLEFKANWHKHKSKLRKKA